MRTLRYRKILCNVAEAPRQYCGIFEIMRREQTVNNRILRIKTDKNKNHDFRNLTSVTMT